MNPISLWPKLGEIPFIVFQIRCSQGFRYTQTDRPECSMPPPPFSNGGGGTKRAIGVTKYTFAGGLLSTDMRSCFAPKIAFILRKICRRSQHVNVIVVPTPYLQRTPSKNWLLSQKLSTVAWSSSHLCMCLQSPNVLIWLPAGQTAKGR